MTVLVDGFQDEISAILEDKSQPDALLLLHRKGIDRLNIDANLTWTGVTTWSQTWKYVPSDCPPLSQY